MTDLKAAIAIAEREKAWLDANVPKYGSLPYPEWKEINLTAGRESKDRLVEAGATIESDGGGAWFDFAGVEVYGRTGFKAALCEWVVQARVALRKRGAK